MTTIPVFPQVVPLDLSHRQAVEAALSRRNPRVSEHCFTEMFMWRHTRKLSLSLLDGSLIVTGGKDDLFFMHPPAGGADSACAMRTALAYYKKQGITAKVYALLEDELDAYGINASHFIIEEWPEHFDYVYMREDLAELKGRKYDGKRNNVKKFLKNYEYIFEPITRENIEECKEFQKEWCIGRGCKDEKALSEEDRGTFEILNNFFSLACFGGALKVNGKIRGYTIATRLNSDTAVVSVEKADNAYGGIYQALNKIFVTEMLADYSFVNREQDMGEEGLRKAKLSYYPHHMVEKKIISLK